MNRNVQKSTEIPQLQQTEQVVDVPVVLVAQAPRVQVVEEAVEIPQLQVVKKIGVIPKTVQISQLQLDTDIRTVQGTQTSERLNTAFLRRVTQAEIGALSTSECGRSANMKRSTQQQDNQPQAARQFSATRERGRKKREMEGRKKEGMLNKWNVMRKEDREKKEKETEDKVKRERKVEKKVRREKRVKGERRKKEGTLRKKSANRLRRT